MKKSVIEFIENKPVRSAWARGVKEYALELMDNIDDNHSETVTLETLLNGASDWSAYSYGGCALIYDCDIAERLCAPWELKRTRYGERNPNGRETWLDVQTRALKRASVWILSAYKTMNK